MLSKIRLELARDHGHPEGDAATGYEFAAPLTGDGKIDADEWHRRRENCRVRRFRRGEADDIKSDEEEDESGYRFADHAFQPGEYVSIREEEGLRTYRVTRVQAVEEH